MKGLIDFGSLASGGIPINGTTIDLAYTIISSRLDAVVRCS